MKDLAGAIEDAEDLEPRVITLKHVGWKAPDHGVLIRAICQCGDECPFHLGKGHKPLYEIVTDG